MGATLPPGFDAYYRSRIEPRLRRLEQQRLRTVRAIHALWVMAAAGLVVLAWGGSGSGASAGIRLLGFVLVLVGFSGYMTLQRRFTGSLKGALVEPVCGFLGYHYESGPAGVSADRFVAAGILSPRFDRSHFEDRIQGERDGVRFDLCEARLERKSNGKKNKDVTVFSGLLLLIEFGKPFRGETRVLPDATALGNWLNKLNFKPARPGERVVLEDPRFEQAFEVYSTDQVEARYLLTPRFMERLLALAGYFARADRPRLFIGTPQPPPFPPRNLSAAFSGQHLLITLATHTDRFQGGGVFRSLLERERVAELVRELALIGDVIRVLGLADRSHA